LAGLKRLPIPLGGRILFLKGCLRASWNAQWALAS
jgi:hypothetical protein